MNSFLGTLRHLFGTADITHIIWCAAILIIMLALAVLHHLWKNDAKKIRLWRLLCLLPLIICAVHEWIYVYGISDFFAWFMPLYLIGIFALFPIPFAKRKIGYRVSAAVSGVLSVFLGFVFCVMAPNCYNHVRESYTESFRSLVRDMDRTYILKEWKEVDFAALEEKYIPLVQEAEHEQNPAKFYNAVSQFCCELHDGHVTVGGGFDVNAHKSETDLNTHEYGLAMVQLDSGDFIAVCTTDELNSLGISDGTVITKWDGKPVLQAAAEDVPDIGLPVKANADRLAAIYLSGVGGETVDVSFIDETGIEKTATLTDLGKMHTRKEALYALRSRPDTSDEEALNAYRRQNFGTRMLTGKCGYLKLQSMTLNNDLFSLPHIMSYLTGDRSYARELFREKLLGLKAQGMEYLVIDLRNNTGGFDEFGAALCELLTTENRSSERLGVRENGQYISVFENDIHGTGEFADLKVVALTNYKCISAGDAAALYLSRLPNVTLAGITDPCGSAQGIGGYSVLSDCIVSVEYPVALSLDEMGSPNVDTRGDRISRNPVEVRIPLDYDAAMRIFRDKEDYEIYWAIKYLENQAE